MSRDAKTANHELQRPVPTGPERSLRSHAVRVHAPKRGDAREKLLLCVAATTFREAAQHVFAAQRDHAVVAVRSFGLVELISGLPLD